MNDELASAPAQPKAVYQSADHVSYPDRQPVIDWRLVYVAGQHYVVLDLPQRDAGDSSESR